MIVLNPSGGRLNGTYSHGALRLGYHTHHLWDQTAEDFLAHETLFPLAVLAGAEGTGKRESILQTVIDMADPKNRPKLERQGVEGNSVKWTNRSDAVSTISIAATLASIYLPRSTIRTILERNDTMTVLLRDFPLSQSFIEEGRQEGRQQAREEALSILLTLARVRHGELNHQVAEGLTNSDRPLKELSELVLQAADQKELNQLLETQN